MKILHLCHSDIQGGAARAAYRLNLALLRSIESHMLVNNKSSDDHTVLRPDTLLKRGSAKLREVLDRLPTWYYQNRTPTLFSPAWVPFSDVADHINGINPDIVHLHWVAAGMMRAEDIAKIKAPIVWSLHDMWAFTGGCHYDEACAGYLKQCGNCKVLGSATSYDLSRWVFNRKAKHFAKHTNLTIVGLSRWLADCAQNSSLFKNNTVVNLPNPIDTQTFAPLEKSIARSLLNLPPDKKLILFGAMNAVSDPRKGFRELIGSLTSLEVTNTELVVFGSSRPKEAPNFGLKAHYLGHLHDDLSLRVLYSAADVMVVPSLQENLSNAIMESLACGTPVVAFNTGGNGDMIEHQINGYLAQAFDCEDLALGIEWVLNAPNYSVLSQNAREKVEREFDSRVVAKKYIDLYQSILNKQST
ncbi:glycosyltransferase family 4 protein [Methylomarinum sp. Ch1-1]|uniref:Glycosyltransferase family 4 protein n=1 Tax=Methylomarinum roseum TaxID=3067653 RepID=A0AAU7NPV1_9GAMM|nr:glycosyltransferase family 4 protein [Methylomarinum sp. Ch1-1]MDP4521079.1 glycosyltransferase family 4 protein [Methylomarinum sp. Ch1-1]